MLEKGLIIHVEYLRGDEFLLKPSEPDFLHQPEVVRGHEVLRQRVRKIARQCRTYGAQGEIIFSQAARTALNGIADTLPSAFRYFHRSHL